MINQEIDEIKKTGGIGTIEHGRADDLFVVCASYEPRSVAVSDALSSNYKANHAFVYINAEFLEQSNNSSTQMHANLIVNALASRSNKIDNTVGSWLNPSEQLKALHALVDSEFHESVKNITIDATTFNRESLLTAIAILRSAYPSAKVRVLYTTPSGHGQWLSRGFRLVRSVTGFPGIQRPILPTALIVLAGFEPDRMIKIVDEYEPSKVFRGTGNPPTDEKFRERNEQEALALSRQEVESFQFPAGNILECGQCLEKIVQPLMGNYNIIMAPMNTKLSTLGAYIVAERYEEIQIAYCLPGEYNMINYSQGASRIYFDELPPLDWS